jgi:hypothetical protein
MGTGAHVSQLRPERLVVRLDRRDVLGQRELEADVRVEVTVGHVVHDLPHGPTAGAVWRLDLLVCEVFDGRAQARRRAGNDLDCIRSPRCIELGRPVNLPVGNRRS